MKMTTIVAFTLVASLVFASAAAPDASGAAQEDEVRLCSALERAVAGVRVPVRLSGVLVLGFEQQVFFDPDEPLCSLDIQPSTWVELPAVQEQGKLDALLKQTGRASVTLRGVILGPPLLGPDDVSISPPLSYANRVAGRRFGHLGAFRTEFVVDEVLSAETAPADIVSRLVTHHPAQVSLDVLEGALPGYPPLARKAGITGDVVVRIVVREGAVTSIEPIFGDRLLVSETTANIKTWRFATTLDTTLTTTFRYDLSHRLSGDPSGSRLEFQLPYLVRITAAADDW